MTTILLLSLAALCVVAPFVGTDRPSLVRRLIDRFVRRVAAPSLPTLRQEQGWATITCDDVNAFQEWLDYDERGFPFREGEMPSLGSHLLVEMFGCDRDSLKAELGVGVAMREAADQSKATVVAESFHEFKPYGVSGAVIIQESHYTIHTWPEHGYAAIDLFYCGGTVHVHRAVDVLRERFKPERMKFLVVRRGLQSEVER